MSRRHYVSYELTSMRFIGQDKKNVFFLCFAVSQDLNQGLTHKNRLVLVQTTPTAKKILRTEFSLFTI